MPIRKKGNIKVKTSPNGYGIERTGYTFYSYDKNSAALVFTFVDSDNAPVNLSKADVRLLLISDNGDEFPVDKDDIDVISAIRGTASYVIPENLLGYEGKITGHIYLEFEDGSHTDEGRFIFNIKRSMISDVLPEAGDKYVQDFEDVKERVEQAGDSTTKDIEKAKDDAESQIGDYMGEVESAKQDISSSASDVQSKASEANEDISNLIKSTEDARDDAVKTMNDLDYSNRNLLTGTSDEWEKTNDKFSGYSGTGYPAVGTDLSEGETVTYSVEIDNTIDQQNDSELFLSLRFTLNNGKIKPFEGNKIPSGEKGVSSVTCVVPSDVKTTRHVDVAQRPLGTQKVGAYRKSTLNYGPLAAPWAPAPEDIALKSELEQIKQAIINLGGSI